MDDFVEIGLAINRSRAYYIQKPHFKKALNPTYKFEVFSEEELSKIKEIMRQYADIVVYDEN